jgi:hypothetical protein
MNELEIKIINELKYYHRGKGNAIHYKHLALTLNLNERELRFVIADLITNRHLPIATSQEGYWWIDSDDEYQQASGELMCRIRKLSARHRGLRLGYIREKQDYKPKQLTFV